jgi:hypothetical protein
VIKSNFTFKLALALPAFQRERLGRFGENDGETGHAGDEMVFLSNMVPDINNRKTSAQTRLSSGS